MLRGKAPDRLGLNDFETGGAELAGFRVEIRPIDAFRAGPAGAEPNGPCLATQCGGKDDQDGCWKNGGSFVHFLRR